MKVSLGAMREDGIAAARTEIADMASEHLVMLEDAVLVCTEYADVKLDEAVNLQAAGSTGGA